MRATTARLAVAGTAGLASILTLSPAAFAEVDDDLAPATAEPATGEPRVEGPAERADPPADDAPAADPPADDAPADPTPDAGAGGNETGASPETPDSTDSTDRVEIMALQAQTFRVGVKIADGAYAPEGTTTAGSRFHIEYMDSNGELIEEYCTSEGAPDADGITWCAVVTPAPAGTTVRVWQDSAASGLVADPDVKRLEPCDPDVAPCGPTDLVFESPGVPPSAWDDSAATDVNTPVVVDVLGNDDSPDPATSIEVTSAPPNGTTEIIVEDGRQKVRYTPDTDFNGRDSFQYTVTNANGSAVATARLEVGEVQPMYGTQKYRVGVQIADGSYAPDATTTTGSGLTVTTTLQDGTSTTFTCTTAPFFLSPNGTESFCEGSGIFGGFTAPAGATVTVVQALAAPGLTASTETLTLPPCTETECSSGPFDNFLVFDNTGPLPVAKDDAARTDEDEAVTIDVLDNDTSTDPATTLAVESQPEDGEAKVVGESAGGVTILAVPSAGTLAIEYTPDEGFSGVDTFEYALSNSNGSSIATVTVQVVDGEVVQPDDEDRDDHADDAVSSDAALPDTGGADARLLGLAGLLLAMGGWFTARGRRKHVVHAE